MEAQVHLMEAKLRLTGTKIHETNMNIAYMDIWIIFTLCFPLLAARAGRFVLHEPES
jgi:hypothetical protein